MDGGFFPLRKTGMEGDYSRIGNGTGIFRQLRMEGKTRRRRDEGAFSPAPNKCGGGLQEKG